MLRNPDEAGLTKYLEDTYPETEPAQQTDEEYKIIKSRGLRHHYIKAVRGFNLLTLEASLGDWGVASWKDKHLSEIIQPLLLRAPEVILEAPWGPVVDVWNLGALLPEMIFGQNMFSGEDSGEYTIRGHLAEMNALLGPFPQTLLSAARLKKAKDMFDEHGNVRKFRLKKVVPLKDRVEDMPEGESPKFEAFTRRMLELDPGRRKTAAEMLEDPWLSHEYTENISVEKVS